MNQEGRDEKMRKRWLCSLLVLAMLVNVTACADVKKEQKSQETESVEQEADRRGEQEDQSEETLHTLCCAAIK